MHIELHRTFHELSQAKGPGSDDEPLYPSGEKLDWTALLNAHRIIVLSEAGSGKTEEIREAAKYLLKQGKAAFFLRLEHVAADFEIAFEEGTFDGFKAWLASAEAAWIFLDSIDESRLKGPSEFERALRNVAHKLASAKQRTHLFIAGRAPAWRPVTDRALCENLFPYSVPAKNDSNVQEDDESAPKPSIEGSADVSSPAFRIVALDDLSPSQVELFAKAKGVTNTKAFLDAIERADAWSFAARPQDLEELTEFWNDAGRIGSRFELMQNSIERRLKERDQNRDEAKPLTLDRARVGAKLLAAATTLMHDQTIRVPDGATHSSGLRIESVLASWQTVDCVTLLSRPLFDEAIYGSVRFHHRSVREYLTAEWFVDLLRKETSRRSVEQLFFRSQYGIEVVVPSLRPILPWLAILDPNILERVRGAAPEILFEGGDPSRLPLAVRQNILEQACEQLVRGTSTRSMADFAAIQRFAGADLTNDMKRLIGKYGANEEVQSFLMRMVWQGRLIGALPEALNVALAATSGRYTRIAAFRAVADLGSKEDMALVRQAFAIEAAVLDRQWLAELLEHAEPQTAVLEWLFDCLGRVADIKQHSIDSLGDQLTSFVTRLNTSQLAFAIDRFSDFLKTPPIIERRHFEVSTRYLWLLHPAGKALERLLIARDSNALAPSSLSILRFLPIVGQYDTFGYDHSKLDLRKLVSQWQPVKWALFWHLVEDERRWLDAKTNERLTDWWRATLSPSYVSFEPSDFEQALQEVGAREPIDDKLVALTLAFKLYVDGGRLAQQRRLLNRVSQSEFELAARLKDLMRPPPQSAESFNSRRMHAVWKRRAHNDQLRNAKGHQAWRKYCAENVDKLRDPGFDNRGAVSNGQHYLFNRVREKKSGESSTWSDGYWQSLEGDFGSDIARAFRDGVVAYWRRYRPQLISEGAATNSTPFEIVFGLAGLSIEFRETSGWAEQLTDAEVEIAFRYAMHELNGFPPWFASLFAAHPLAVAKLSLCEISYELYREQVAQYSYYLLHDVAWAGDFLWNALAPELVALLRTKEPVNVQTLRDILNVIQSSNCPGVQLDQLASVKVATAENSVHAAHWLAAWTGVAPDAAIDALEKRLQQNTEAAERAKFAMTYVTQLLGGRRDGGSKVRGAFRIPRHLKRLYLLVHQHVRSTDDIHRANNGVYSPQLRDDAQDAREHLLALLIAIPGKEAFLALKEISHAHPDEAARPWLTSQSKSKAELDAESGKWSAEQVRDFNEMFERTPSNHRELFDLAVLRLLDLKADLEEGDSSEASILVNVTDEIEMRKFIGNRCRQASRGRYSIPQEEELADAKRPDFRWHGSGFDGPVPTELKLADNNWGGPKLFERLESQLCGDYLRDARSSRGIYLLFYRGAQAHWELPSDGRSVDFDGLIAALQEHWLKISGQYPGVDEIRVIGIDLTKRSNDSGRKEFAPTAT